MLDDDWEYRLGRLLEVLDNRGVRRVIAAPSQSSPDMQQFAVTTKKYQRTFSASRRRTLDAVSTAVAQLKYAEAAVAVERARVTFTAGMRTMTVDVVDAGPGLSSVVVTMPTLTGGSVGFGSLLVAATGIGVPALAALPALRLWERRFARGFLDNVDSVLQGRGVNSDSAQMPGVEQWRNRIQDV
jgi:hypothetical protein